MPCLKSRKQQRYWAIVSKCSSSCMLYCTVQVQSAGWVERWWWWQPQLGPQERTLKMTILGIIVRSFSPAHHFKFGLDSADDEAVANLRKTGSPLICINSIWQNHWHLMTFTGIRPSGMDQPRDAWIREGRQLEVSCTSPGCTVD
jgi:hypothetical protein